MQGGSDSGDSRVVKGGLPPGLRLCVRRTSGSLPDGTTDVKERTVGTSRSVEHLPVLTGKCVPSRPVTKPAETSPLTFIYGWYDPEDPLVTSVGGARERIRSVRGRPLVVLWDQGSRVTSSLYSLDVLSEGPGLSYFVSLVFLPRLPVLPLGTPWSNA